MSASCLQLLTLLLFPLFLSLSHPLSPSLKSWVEPCRITLNKYSKGGGSGGGRWAGSTSRRLSTGTATGSKVYSGFNFTFQQPIRKQRLHWPSGCRSINSLATEASAAPPRPLSRSRRGKMAPDNPKFTWQFYFKQEFEKENDLIIILLLLQVRVSLS